MRRNPAAPGLMDIVTPDLESIRLYRLYVLFRIPDLLMLDSTDVTAEERGEAAVRGQFAVKRSTVKAAALGNQQSVAPNPFFHAQPDDDATAERESESGESRGSNAVLGVSRSRYDGRNSEGNRFISNRNL
mmetsp:Transcript_11836/g.32007  ORF Transcript_11836/g.32007 Transcript_11836/m.32007 type:complete len:131 (+) Transcript_11836:3835-4227(+)